ncbi:MULTISPECIES: DUF362 domain-containing protein [Methanothermobacter]|uniref:DUF362 domain-containing protein n=1 Tax=Methanothermobacter wolfeii TaxID=145261 RepID=A0A9E7UNV7_METWO|nr:MULTISPECIES: DUF362 domain-containing protein [Methanothermobacter]QHN07236.1 DUF362 domain-containing protein [Methanothermobacter sp. THM-1]UXH32632.1 DUF362 domain-containing protein [Methanothermobacter wolfeii]
MKPISISRCTSYDPDEVETAIRECLQLLGGAGRFASRGDRVLLKPNMLMAATPERHVTTHPAVVEATARVFIDTGAEVRIGDSPGGSFRNIERFWRATGMLDVAGRLDIELVNFEASGSYIIQGYPVSRPVIDSDVVVNLPKIKTHSMTIFTCAVKNMYGAVPGFRKAEYHREHPRPSDFAERLLEIYRITAPSITLVDGITGMEGNGPSGGTPRDIGLILGSEDAMALDVYIPWILGMDPERIPVNAAARRMGHHRDPDDVEVLGHEPERIEDFRWPSNIYYTLDLLPSGLARALMRLWWSRPAIDPDKCRNCNLCVESCPVDALSPGVIIPEFDYGECINCLCCMEVCPHAAFYQDKSLLYRLTGRFSGILK